jgi:double-stranded uracil-DNA glycosylase
MIKDQIGYGLKILFIGVNPHPGSYRRGVPFSNNKMFWYLLYAAGLIEESREVLQDDVQLKYLYMHVFKKKYQFGWLNIANKPSRTASEIDKDEVVIGRKRVFNAIKKYKPQIVCFVGKITYSLFVNSSKVDFGWQSSIGPSKIFVSHVPHRGLASVRIKEFREIICQT